MEYKYLSDGRKVVVIGQLNNVESIVQEVFITKGGDQVPSGEKFTTKSLHDEPVKSYKEKEIDRLEEVKVSIKSQIKRMETERDDVSLKLKGLREFFKQSRLLSENLDPEKLDTLAGFMSGTIKYIVYKGYGMPTLVDFMNDVIVIDNWCGNRSFQGIKLINILGKSDGDLEYRINRYSDGSGSTSISAFPFNTKEEAVKKIIELVEAEIEKDRFPTLKELAKFSAGGVVFNEGIIQATKKSLIDRNNKYSKDAETKHEEYMLKNKNETDDIENNFDALIKANL